MPVPYSVIVSRSDKPSSASSNAITECVEQQLAEVDRAIRRCARVPNIQPLEQVLLAVLTAPAKRLRPTLALLVAETVGGHPQDVVKLAAATEILHCATLVHDDLVDGADERRGRPAVHVAWSQKVAVLAGDYLFASAADLVAQLDRPPIVRLFAATIRDMARSEFIFPDWDADGDATERQYLEKIGHKTASLFAHACESVATLADVSSSECEALRELGWNVGMAFQITDDILDIRGFTAETGKPIGTDFRAGLITLPVILYLRCEPPSASHVRAVLSGCARDDADVAEALEAISTSSALDEAVVIARGFADRAISALARVRPAPAGALLETFVRQATERSR